MAPPLFSEKSYHKGKLSAIKPVSSTPSSHFAFWVAPLCDSDTRVVGICADRSTEAMVGLDNQCDSCSTSVSWAESFYLHQVNAASEAREDSEIEAAMHLLRLLMHLAEEKYDFFSQETNHNAKMIPVIHWKHPFFHGTVVMRDSASTNKGFHVYTCVK